VTQFTGNFFGPILAATRPGLFEKRHQKRLMLKPKLMFAPKLFGQQSGSIWNCHHGKYGRNFTVAVSGTAM
jgi:hypothetical protein